MSRQRLFSARIVRLSAVMASCAVCVALMGASRGAITKLTLDPDIPVVDLFDGIDHGQFDVRLVAQNANEGKIFITNKTDKPLTVEIPKGLVGVQILAQPGFNVGNMMIGGPNAGNGQVGQNGQKGAAQAVGGNAVPAPNNGVNNGFPGNNGNNGNGIFSIPPEKTVQIGLSSVCLNHGRREPHAGLKYQLVRAESVTTDPLVLQLLENYSPTVNREAQQAAAWHLASGLTWEQIAQLSDEKLAGLQAPLFTAQQIQNAQTLVEQVKKDAADRPKKADTVRSVVTNR